jgi:flagellar basal body-associated protein FliL
MAKLIPVILIVLGLGAGLGAGLMLRPAPEADSEGAEPVPPIPVPDPSAIALFEFDNHFMVPLVVDDRIASVIVIKVALEVSDAHRAMVVSHAPRLRDRLLQAMFDHANMGGFQGTFTANDNLGMLRRGLLEAAQATLGPEVIYGVLITDLLRTGA